MDPTQLQKAQITNLATGDVLTCLFNPKEYALTRQNQWEAAKTKGGNVPSIEFKSGQPATLQMQLFFDTYSDGQDVRKHTGPLWGLMHADPTNPKLVNKKTKVARPPTVKFQWGKTISFEAAITNLTQRYTLFLPDGTPVRATVDVTFLQVKDEKQLPLQNPTSHGEGGERLWTVRQGDSLVSIAQEHFGDPNAWRQIADVNHLERVRPLAPGTVLLLPYVE